MGIVDALFYHAHQKVDGNSVLVEFEFVAAILPYQSDRYCVGCWSIEDATDTDTDEE